MSQRELQQCRKCSRKWEGINGESCPFCGYTSSFVENEFGLLGSFILRKLSFNGCLIVIIVIISLLILIGIVSFIINLITT